MINRLASAFLFVVCVSGFANPSEPVVMAGEASFHAPESHALHIHVNDQSIIHWKDFSIAKGEITKFIQPSADSMVLNRVIGDNLSEIFGRLESNGELLLINPNGILFGENAVVDTASF